jgi:hypothetical protein
MEAQRSNIRAAAVSPIHAALVWTDFRPLGIRRDERGTVPMGVRPVRGFTITFTIAFRRLLVISPTEEARRPQLSTWFCARLRGSPVAQLNWM